MQETIPRGLRPIIIGSAVGHVVLIVGFAIGTWIMARREPAAPQAAIVTKLVKLGKQRDEKLLPRLPSAPPPAAAAIALPAPGAKPEGATEKSVQAATERLKQLSQVASALDRLKQSADSGAGHPEGVPEGEVTDLDKAIMGSKYTTEVYRCMKESFRIEGLPPDRVRGRQATILVKAKGDGTLYGGTLTSTSGLAPLDDAVLLAVRRCGKVSPPPAELADTVAREGILIEFIP